RRRVRQDHIGLQIDQLFRRCLHPLDIAGNPAHVHSQIAAINPSELGQSLSESGYPRSCIRIAFVPPDQDANPTHLLTLLRPCCDRPCRCRAAEEGNELAPSHSITSSAMASKVGGTSMPSSRAVCRLMTSSNRTALITGRSPGFSPLRMRPTYM